MKLSLFSRLKKDRRGLALIIVVTSIALISVLVVAIFSVTRTEFRATQSYVAAKSAKQLGDISVSIVQAQIQNGQATTTQGTFHATQPGMVRVYNSDGSFNSGLKLYSSQQMRVTGEEDNLLSAANLAPSNWDTLPARFVDLNEPVIRPGSVTTAEGQSNGYSIYFPIIDPRAAFNSGQGDQNAGQNGVPGTSQVEGFSYEESSALLGTAGTSYAQQVVTPAESPNDAKRLRLPMPVEWMYILEDGSVGSLNAANTFISSSGGPVPSATNPIVGRIAFWTDDESCKININTASEPTFMSTPFYYHQRDAKWAHFPATTGEYQRYPGHPATTALSAVLAPNYLLDPYLPGRDGGNLSRAQVVELKQQIYDLIPKIGRGGSEGGTRPFVEDDFSSQNGEGTAAISVNLTESSRERLFASVDEMLFLQSGYTPTNGRAPARFAMPGAANQFLFDHDTLERSRFFLTAHSRSPEFTLHGLPRVCMWPISDESLEPKRRTTFDNMIALCGTIKRLASDDVNSGSPDRTYYFRRAVSYTDPNDSRSGGQSGSTFDLTGNATLSRNTDLLQYLSRQMSELEWPATGASGAGTAGGFDDKYGMQNVYQLAVQFFDYIRCTNLYDGILARDNDAGGKPGGYLSRDNQRSDNFTYTSQRISQSPNTVDNVTAELGANKARANTSGVLPGHGQVSPAMWEKEGTTYKGFGRMLTISEIGFQFICTADGQPDDRSLTTFPAPTLAGQGGGTAIRYEPEMDAVANPNRVNIPNLQAYTGFAVNDFPYAVWYSNFPPISNPQGVEPGTAEKAMIDFYGCNADEVTSPTHPAKHPGFSPANWNYSLAANTPLNVNEKRVQMTFLLETFCPSVGWTKFYPEFTITIDGDSAAQMKLNGEDLFNTTGPIPIKSNGNIYDDNSGRASPMGGHVGPTQLLAGRRTRTISGGGGKGGPAADYGSLGGLVLLPSDTGYGDDNTSGHQALSNYTLVSDYVTVNRDRKMEFTFPQEPLVIKIYDTHSWESATPVQEIRINFNQLNLPTTLPVPHLVGSTNPIDGYKPDPKYHGGPRVNTENGVMNGQYFSRIDGNGRNQHYRSLQGPHYWGYLFDGVIGRGRGQFNAGYTKSNDQGFWSIPPEVIASGADSVAQLKRGRLDTTAAIVDRPLPPGDYYAGVGIIPDATSDVIRTIVPAVGDYRILAARRFVPTEMWTPHPLWQHGYDQIRQAHSFSGYQANSEPGASFSIRTNDPSAVIENYVGNYGDLYRRELQLVGGAGYQMINDTRFEEDLNNMRGRHPDLPPHEDWAKAANAFGDFDTGLSGAREGSYINKPDEGNFFANTEIRNGVSHFERQAYFRESWEDAEDWRSGIYMTPNRLIASPVMLGSLPTGVWGGNGGLPSARDMTSLGSLDYAPWQTLLFRPHSQITSQQPNSHSSHPGAYDPADHYLLDLFFMPVVEPYAISEPLSMAGRVNMNYQMMPFPHIRRATGLHAVMKGEYITAIPTNEINRAKGYRARNGGTAWDDTFWNDTDDAKYWHRPIDVRATLRQFDNRFKHTAGIATNAMGLFRSATQICETHLVPVDVQGSGTTDANAQALRSANSQAEFDSAMNNFWSDNRVTGDNVRERVYSNLYARLTTRTNTFRIHMRTQTLKKARSTSPATFDPVKDAVTSEYRGSALLERYIDPNDGSGGTGGGAVIPDYADSTGPFAGGRPPLDAFYRFRMIESKRFAP